MNRSEKIHAGSGRMPADLLLENARIVNVFSGEIVQGSIALKNGYIAGVGDYPAHRKLDMDGRFVAPGFIDAHVHIESSLAHPVQFAKAILVSGTTTIVADPHEIANVMGRRGIDYMLAEAENSPFVDIFYCLPSCVPATSMETSGAVLTAADLQPYLDHDRIVGLAEVMNYPGVIQADASVLAKIEQALLHKLRIDGHAPGLAGKDLAAYVAAGISSDHECSTAHEAREKLMAGMHIMVREGTAAKNLEALLPVINNATARRMMWCTDDRHPHELEDEGHIDALVRKAVIGGIDPVTAIQMATINPSQYFGLRQVGAIAPGRQADLIVFSDLDSIRAEQVYRKGILVAENGRMTAGPIKPLPAAPAPIMNLDVSAIDLAIPASPGRARVIELVPGQLITNQWIGKIPSEKGFHVSQPSRDILKIAVVERYTGSTGIGKGFVKGFGLQAGAIASSIAHDSHNIICVGTNDKDMQIAMASIVRMGGGLAVASNARVLATLALPIAGLMSTLEIRDIRKSLDTLLEAAKNLGSTLHDPFMTLSFLALPVIPALKITDKGLFDVAQFRPVPLHLD